MKIQNLFKKNRANVVNTIEASIYENDTITLPTFEGMYTIKNINPKTSDDLFYFRPEVNMIKGYVDAPNAETLTLIDGKPKLIVSIVYSFYHAVLDSMSAILYALEKHPNHNVVIDVSDIWGALYGEGSSWDIFNTFVETLRENGTEVNLVRLKKYDVIYIDNFCIVDFVYETGKKSNLVYDFFKQKVTNPDALPNKSVFVSRRFSGDREDVDAEGLSYPNDRRMDDHIALENYFADLGYEIIHAERFNSFQEQLDYFYSAKTIVGITGSGLTNAVFMQPGGTMFEIVTPMVVTVPFPGESKDITKPFFVQEVHNFYKNIAYYQNHTFVCVQNPNRSFAEFTEVVKNSPGLLKFLDRNE
jgi:hypothetical protein